MREARSQPTGQNRAAAKLDLLVLGGTGFIGPHLVRHAVGRGHHVTIFTRGRRNADLPAEVIRLKGDRNGDLKSLEGKKWDAVVDDSATNPDWVRQSTSLLKGNVGRYLFTSSTGVYYPYLFAALTKLLRCVQTPTIRKTNRRRLALRRRGVNAKCKPRSAITPWSFGRRTSSVLVIRPIAFRTGPSGLYAVVRCWHQAVRDDPVQFIDVRDLAEFMVRLLEDRRGGIYNVVGPQATMTMPAFLEQARAALDCDATFTQVDDYAFLTQHKIEEAIPWAMLKGNDDGMMSIRHERAEAAGLKYRPLAASVRDTHAWWLTVPEARRKAPKFTISPAQEAETLAAWHAVQDLSVIN